MIINNKNFTITIFTLLTSIPFVGASTHHDSFSSYVRGEISVESMIKEIKTWRTHHDSFSSYVRGEISVESMIKEIKTWFKQALKEKDESQIGMIFFGMENTINERALPEREIEQIKKEFREMRLQFELAVSGSVSSSSSQTQTEKMPTIDTLERCEGIMIKAIQKELKIMFADHCPRFAVRDMKSLDQDPRRKRAIQNHLYEVVKQKHASKGAYMQGYGLYINCFDKAIEVTCTELNSKLEVVEELVASFIEIMNKPDSDTKKKQLEESVLYFTDLETAKVFYIKSKALDYHIKALMKISNIYTLPQSLIGQELDLIKVAIKEFLNVRKLIAQSPKKEITTKVEIEESPKNRITKPSLSKKGVMCLGKVKSKVFFDRFFEKRRKNKKAARFYDSVSILYDILFGGTTSHMNTEKDVIDRMIEVMPILISTSTNKDKQPEGKTLKCLAEISNFFRPRFLNLLSEDVVFEIRREKLVFHTLTRNEGGFHSYPVCSFLLCEELNEDLKLHS